MQVELMQALISILLTIVVYFISRFIKSIDGLNITIENINKKVEVLEDRVLTIEIEKKTEKEITKVANAN